MSILYLDEDVKSDVADLLLAPDRSVRTTRREGRLRAGDPFQLLYAAEQMGSSSPAIGGITIFSMMLGFCGHIIGTFGAPTQVFSRLTRGIPSK